MIESDLFRIYKCSTCKNSGFVPVSSKDAEARCSLCNGLILQENGTLYATSIEEAKVALTELLLLSRLDAKKVGSSRGLGVKRRVLNIVESVIEINRGHPARWNQVMSECSDAGIDYERASHFVDVLKREGALTEEGGGLVMNGEGVVT